MAADRALDQALMAERIQAAVFSIALASGEQERQIARLAGLNKALFQSDKQSIGHANADKAGRANRIPIE